MNLFFPSQLSTLLLRQFIFKYQSNSSNNNEYFTSVSITSDGLGTVTSDEISKTLLSSTPIFQENYYDNQYHTQYLYFNNNQAYNKYTISFNSTHMPGTNNGLEAIQFFTKKTTSLNEQSAKLEILSSQNVSLQNKLEILSSQNVSLQNKINDQSFNFETLNSQNVYLQNKINEQSLKLEDLQNQINYLYLKVVFKP